MNWFYASQGQRAGPVDEHEFAKLVADGVINDATLIWCKGMPDWLSYAQARVGDPAGASASLDPDRVQCSQCGGVFPADEVVRVEGYNVCAACKPFLLQKVYQGLSPAAGAYGIAPVYYAGFWIRVAARFLDGLIMMPVTLGLWLLAFFNYPAAVIFDPAAGYGPLLLFRAVLYALAAVYEIFFLGRFGASPGKMICGLRVVRPDETPMSYGRATGRFFAWLLSSFTLYLGCVMAAFDYEKRALHDYMADTRVVYK